MDVVPVRIFKNHHPPGCGDNEDIHRKVHRQQMIGPQREGLNKAD